MSSWKLFAAFWKDVARLSSEMGNLLNSRLWDFWSQIMQFIWYIILRVLIGFGDERAVDWLWVAVIGVPDDDGKTFCSSSRWQQIAVKLNLYTSCSICSTCDSKSYCLQPQACYVSSQSHFECRLLSVFVCIRLVY